MRGDRTSRRPHGKLATTLVACLTLAGQAYAAGPGSTGVSDKEFAAYELMYAARVLHTLENEVRMVTSEPEMLGDGYAWLTDGLASIRDDLGAVAMPDDIKPLRDSLIAITALLPPVATASRAGDNDTATEHYRAFFKALDAYYEQWNPMVSGLADILPESDAAGGPTPDTDWMPDDATRGTYERAVTAIGEQNYEKAAELLLALLPIVKDTPAEGIVLHRVLECHMPLRSPLSNAPDVKDRMLELLRDHLDRRVYSPSLPMLYFHWQTLHQMTMNGMSNYSTIDYALYNEVFRQCADVIIERIRADRDDPEARITIWTLFGIPIIERFPANYQFGNSVAMHHAYLSRFFEDHDASDEGGE